MPQNVSVVSAGIVVVDHVAAPIEAIPQSGELVLTDDCQLHLGGCASNVAIDLARLNVPTRVVGCVGDDILGRFARQSLEDERVDASGLIVCHGTPTSQTLVLNVRGQDRRFVHLIGANRSLTASMLPMETISRANVLYVGGFFLMDGLIAGELAAVFQSARRSGVRTVLDVVTPGPRDYESALADLLPHTDYFLPNEDEARRMTNLDLPLDQARRFRELGASAAVITRGGKGCIYSSPDEEFEADTFETTFVDGTGGGDAFDAGFIAALIRGLDPVECVRWGSAMGASCVRASGATQGVFRSAELEEFLQQHSLHVRRIS